MAVSKSKNKETPLNIGTVEKPKAKKKQERLATVIDQSYFMRRGMSRTDANAAALDFNAKMHEWVENQTEIERLQTLVDITKSEAFELAKAAYIEFYTQNKTQPQNFHVVSGDNDLQFMFQGTDSYIKIDKIQAESLKKRYGHDIVTETEVVKFDAVLFKKYLPQIKAAIQGMNIPHTDLQNLLKKEIAYEVAKGTIGNIMHFTQEGDGEVKVIDVIEHIKPIFKILPVALIEQL